ncbi:DUF5050 domain-containing protein [Flavobacteriaceae bacterium S356]|uniref:DUF5050 domain-containing protein n=1 Tax=Asprobacillus argus TaxID=3076534 RepID=A0ABU3LGL9_9FLAO|nr:DUF5050 domain-containing protein [Flavobacteriaceae bacterium S356]
MKILHWLLFILVLLCISTTIHSQEYQILFTKQINGSDQLFTLDSYGTLKQITKHPRKDSSPVISPSGSHIIFTSERVGWWKIWSMDIKKNSFKQLTNSNAATYNPSWSPNGKKIVFVSSKSGNSDIYIMDKRGQKQKRITRSKKTDTMPMWGNDNFIYYSSEIDGIYQIVKIKPDGSGRHIITTGTSNKFAPQLSKDKKKILYYGDKDGNLEIYVYDILDKKTTRITKNPLMDIRPKWSFDDTKIVFERGNKRNNQHIYIMNADGSNQKKLTNRNYNYAPSFIPIKFKIE